MLKGPHIHDVTFRGFADIDVSGDTKFCGIKFRDAFKFGMGASSSVRGLDFGDTAYADRICHRNMKFGMDEPSMMLRDLDGTLTGTAGVSVTADTPFYHEGKECETNNDWNMTVCQGNLPGFICGPKLQIQEIPF